MTTAQELQTALTLAASNADHDTVYLAEGLYQGNFSFNSTEAYALTIQSEAGADASKVIVDPTGAGSALALTLQQNGNLTLQGITVLRNSGNEDTYAVYLLTGAEVQLDNCQFIVRADGQNGAGVWINKDANWTPDAVTITNCRFEGRGINGRGRGLTITECSSPAQITDCVVTNNYLEKNTDVGADLRGAGIWLSAGGCTLTRVTVSGNVLNYFNYDYKPAYGCGVFIGGDSTINNCRFSSNGCDGTSKSSGVLEGGALYNAGNCTVLDSNFSSNYLYSYRNTHGGAVYISGNGEIRNSNFSHNKSYSSNNGQVYEYNSDGASKGGAVYINLIGNISGSVFKENMADRRGRYNSYYSGCNYQAFGGACYIRGTLSMIENNKFVINQTLCANWGDATSNYSYSRGGAVYVENGSNATFLDNEFDDNSSYVFSYDYKHFRFANGGAIYGVGAFLGNIFTNNKTFDERDSTYNSGGGAVFCGAYASGNKFSNNEFRGNSVTGATANSGCGGAVFGSDIELTNNWFEGNTAANEGGAVRITESSNQKIIGNTFISNTSTVSTGGAVRCFVVGSTTSDKNVMVISDNLFIKNKAATGAGGGICITSYLLGKTYPATLHFCNNTLTENTAKEGGGLRLELTGTEEIVDAYNNIIWGNVASNAGDDIYKSGTGTRTYLNNNIVHGLFGVWTLANNNLDRAPFFFNPASLDYHLRAGSAGIDAGDNSAPYVAAMDRDGSTRILGSAIDLGCYEFGTSAFHPADANEDWTISEAEFTAYAAAWKQTQTFPQGPDPVPASYVTRAGFIQLSGGVYSNDGSGKPTCWKPTE